MEHPDIKATVNKRKAELAEFEVKAQQAASKQGEVDGMRRDLERLRKRRDYFASLGDEPLRVPYRLVVPPHGELTMRPLETAMSGNELAAAQQQNLDHLESEIARAEREIKELLS